MGEHMEKGQPVCYYGGKRLRRQSGEIWLLPENEDYEPIDGSEAQVLGRVTAVIRQY